MARGYPQRRYRESVVVNARRGAKRLESPEAVEAWMDALTGGVRVSYNLPKKNWRDCRSVRFEAVAAQSKVCDGQEQEASLPMRGAGMKVLGEVMGMKRYRGGWPGSQNVPYPASKNINQHQQMLVR